MHQPHTNYEYTVWILKIMLVFHCLLKLGSFGGDVIALSLPKLLGCRTLLKLSHRMRMLRTTELFPRSLQMVLIVSLEVVCIADGCWHQVARSLGPKFCTGLLYSFPIHLPLDEVLGTTTATSI